MLGISLLCSYIHTKMNLSNLVTFFILQIWDSMDSSYWNKFHLILFSNQSGVLLTFCWTGNWSSWYRIRRPLFEILFWTKPNHGRSNFQAWSPQAYTWFGVIYSQKWTRYWEEHFGLPSNILCTGTAVVPLETIRWMFQGSYFTSEYWHWTSSESNENLEIPS